MPSGMEALEAAAVGGFTRSSAAGMIQWAGPASLQQSRVCPAFLCGGCGLGPPVNAAGPGPPKPPLVRSCISACSLVLGDDSVHTLSTLLLSLA